MAAGSHRTATRRCHAPGAQRARTVRDIEEEASAFSAELLMPRWLLVRQHARARGDIAELCRAFDASNAAMERRIADVFGVRTP